MAMRARASGGGKLTARTGARVAALAEETRRSIASISARPNTTQMVRTGWTGEDNGAVAHLCLWHQWSRGHGGKMTRMTKITRTGAFAPAGAPVSQITRHSLFRSVTHLDPDTVGAEHRGHHFWLSWLMPWRRPGRVLGEAGAKLPQPAIPPRVTDWRHTVWTPADTRQNGLRPRLLLALPPTFAETRRRPRVVVTSHAVDAHMIHKPAGTRTMQGGGQYRQPSRSLSLSAVLASPACPSCPPRSPCRLICRTPTLRRAARK